MIVLQEKQQIDNKQQNCKNKCNYSLKNKNKNKNKIKVTREKLSY